MVLISDGQANAGLCDRDELAQLATETAARGVSISTVGVGLDFDELTMTRLADVGHGHYYFVEDTAKLGADVRARARRPRPRRSPADVRLVITGAGRDTSRTPTATRSCATARQVVVPIADLRAGETRKVVLRSTSRRRSPARSRSPQFELALAPHVATAVTEHGAHERSIATVVDATQAAVAASIDRGAVNAVEQARTARVLEDATTDVRDAGRRGGAARDRAQHARRRANKNIDAPAMQAIEAASNGAIGNFAKAPPAKAKKATRADAYELAR